jgi:hypothetical protein
MMKTKSRMGHGTARALVLMLLVVLTATGCEGRKKKIEALKLERAEAVRQSRIEQQKMDSIWRFFNDRPKPPVGLSADSVQAALLPVNVRLGEASKRFKQADSAIKALGGK